MSFVDCDMRSGENRAQLRYGHTYRRPSGGRIRVLEWSHGFAAWRCVALDGPLAGREVLVSAQEAFGCVSESRVVAGNGPPLQKEEASRG